MSRPAFPFAAASLLILCRCLILCGCLLLSGCALDPASSVGPMASVPLDARLASFASLHSTASPDGLRPYFAEGAQAQSPVMPRAGSVEDYLRRASLEPFSMRITHTEILYATGARAKTRSRAILSSPGKFSLDTRLDVTWAFEEGEWKIAVLSYPDWPAVVGTWKRANRRGEFPLELRILPGGTYALFAERDRSDATFRGSWTFANGALTLTDSTASPDADLNRSPGAYAVITTGNTAEFRLLADDNRWRSERFPGMWTSAR